LGRARVLPPDPESQRRIEHALAEMTHHLPAWSSNER
jgi:hypothetical protein